MSEAVVSLEDVTRLYETGIGVLHLDLRVCAGRCLALIGPNGSGKTTTLRLVMGMLRPDKGQVRIFGKDPTEQPVPVKQRIGYLAEDQTLPPSLRPADVFRFLAGLYPRWDPEYESELTDRLELPLWRPLGMLSRGQRRAVGLVGALAHRPRLLVLDEPAGGLDPLVRRAFLENVIEVLAEEGAAVLFSSHHLDQVERLADEIAFLDRGQVVVEGETAAFLDGAVELLVDTDDLQRARALPGVLGARRMEDRVALTLLDGGGGTAGRVAEALETTILQERSLGLEDLFVRLAERHRS